jgi:uncharacterized membrane protein YfcA
MNIRLVLWTMCMGIAGFMLTGETPSFTSMTILSLCVGASIGAALGIMFAHRAKRKRTQQVTKILAKAA